MPGKKGATLAIRIISDASKAPNGFNQAEARVGGFQKSLDKASVVAGGTLAVVEQLAEKAFDASSRLQQAGGAVESVFGAQADAVDKLAAKAADRVGLATAAYDEMASVLGSQLKNVGYSGDALVKQQDDLIKKGSDLAATFGGTTADAVEALSSLLRGERDPIERYGVSINQAGIDAQIASMHLDTHTAAAKRAAGIQATLAILAAQTAQSVGQFSREADSAAGSTQRAAANWEDAKAKLGQGLLPVVTAGAGIVSGLTGKLTEHQGAVTAVTLVVAGLAVTTLAVNAALRAYAAVQVLVTAGTWAWNAALDANPVVLVVAAIAALVLAVVAAYQKFQWFRDLIKDLWDWLVKAFKFVSGGWVDDAVHAIWGAPLAATVTHATTAAAAPATGVYGAAAGPVPAPVYGAPMTALSGSRSRSAQGPRHTQRPIVINVNGALDPVAVGRQVIRSAKRYSVATGAVTTVTTKR